MKKGRKGLTQVQQERVWEVRAEGLSDAEVARRLGLEQKRVNRYLNACGGIRPRRARRRRPGGSRQLGGRSAARHQDIGDRDLVERQTRYCQLIALPEGFRAEPVRRALAQSIMTLPRQLRSSLTWDQGPEMSEHRQFSVDSGVEVYFCDPRSPWQRGSNENTNGLLRQYFPKSADRRLDLTA